MTPQLRGIEASPVKNGGVDLLDSPHMPASASLREDQRQFDRAVRVRLLGGLFFDECAYDSPRETRLVCRAQSVRSHGSQPPKGKLGQRDHIRLVFEGSGHERPRVTRDYFWAIA